jgi:hypothetical protein
MRTKTTWMARGFVVSVAALALPALANCASPEGESGGEGEGVEEASAALVETIFDGPGGTTFTQCNGMHCCPNGFAMTGANVDKNRFTCRRVMPDDQLVRQSCFVDEGTQRFGMHACPFGHYMRGLHVGHNDLTCCRDSQRFPNQPLAERVDDNTQENGMHACVSSLQEAMIGIHVSRNDFVCGQFPE